MTYYAKYLKTMGEMVVVCSIVRIKANLEGLGMLFIFLGYAQNHTGGAFHMLDLLIKIIILSRGVI